jgi:hypothetical protein
MSRPTVRPTPRWRPAQVAQATWALFFFLVPAVSYIAFVLGVTGFVPTLRLKPLADAAAVAVALMYAAMLGPLFLRQLRSGWQRKNYKSVTQSAALAGFAPFAGWCLTQVFFAAPASYALHRMQNVAVTTTEVVALRADDLGGRRCRNRAVLNQERFFWRRELCGISEEAVVKLRRGGRLGVQGTVTSYGMQVQRYAYSDA